MLKCSESRDQRGLTFVTFSLHKFSLITSKIYNKIASVKVFDILNSTLIWIHPNSIERLRAVRELIAPVHNPWVAQLQLSQP